MCEKSNELSHNFYIRMKFEFDLQNNCDVPGYLGDAYYYSQCT